MGGNPATAGGPARVEWPGDRYSDSMWAKAGLPPATLFFNSGVMLIDIDTWRADEIARKVLAVSETVPTNDQALLNMVLWDRWMPLDTRWNSRSPDAVIAHFAGRESLGRPTTS